MGVVEMTTPPETVKPVDLMRWLVKLVTPPGGTCLDPFLGSGTTGMACVYEGFNCIGIEREPEYVEIAKARIAYAVAQKAAEPPRLFDVGSEPAKPRKRRAAPPPPPSSLFD